MAELDLESALEEMVRARTYSTRLFNLQRQGRVGTMAPILGGEAAVVGSIAAIEPGTDWVLPQYREPMGFSRLGDAVIDAFALYCIGHPAGGEIPPGTRCFPPQISLATQIPHAVGLAWGRRLQGFEEAVLVYFGDGSSSEGDFYEAGNLAGVQRAPVVLFCVNNSWAISTPMSQQTAAESIAAKAAAFGIPGCQVDGNDVEAVFAATREARARAVAGDGPTLIEAVTYRLGPHTTADDPTRYVPDAELKEATRRDPVVRLRDRFVAEGRWSTEREQQVIEAAEARLDTAMERAEAMAVPAEAMVEHVYAQPSPRLARQQRSIAEMGAVR